MQREWGWEMEVESGIERTGKERKGQRVMSMCQLRDQCDYCVQQMDTDKKVKTRGQKYKTSSILSIVGGSHSGGKSRRDLMGKWEPCWPSQSLGRLVYVDSTDQAGLSSGHTPGVAMAFWDEGTNSRAPCAMVLGCTWAWVAQLAHLARGLNASAHAWVHDCITVTDVGSDVKRLPAPGVAHHAVALALLHKPSSRAAPVAKGLAVRMPPALSCHACPPGSPFWLKGASHRGLRLPSHPFPCASPVLLRLGRQVPLGQWLLQGVEEVPQHSYEHRVIVQEGHGEAAQACTHTKMKSWLCRLGLQGPPSLLWSVICLWHKPALPRYQEMTIHTLMLPLHRH